jgi:hypothetical protein
VRKNYKKEPLYLIDQDDAYRIEGLISMLVMAVWEILREGEMKPSPPHDEDDPTIAQDSFRSEVRRILKNPDIGDF